jgi:UDP-N-acetylmuramyl pentapeptide phosphotransferase/UDP-N-acetylglucosamine-1-phosphate transferase
MGSRACITGLNVIKPSTELLKETGFLMGDKLLKINNIPIENGYPDGAIYKDIDSYLVERKVVENEKEISKQVLIKVSEDAKIKLEVAKEIFGPKDKSFIYRTNLPFWKNYVFDYSEVWILGKFIHKGILGKIMYLIVVIFIVTAVSNGVNITDGIDGLAAGTSAIVGAALGIFAYLSGNSVFSNYLNISYIPLSSELIVYSAALVGACIGFLWYNTSPAEVFMGDTGSLALGGAIAVVALMVKKELLLPILCGIFFVESLSVIIQVSYFKYTKRKYGEGRRIFRMSPLHHHFEKGGLAEQKIVMRFFIVAILLAVLSFATLKLR